MRIDRIIALALACGALASCAGSTQQNDDQPLFALGSGCRPCRSQWRQRRTGRDEKKIAPLHLPS